MIPLTSSQNPVIKEIKSLKHRRNREKLKKFFIEGQKFVEEALLNPAQIEYILTSEAYVSKNNTAPLLHFCQQHQKKMFSVANALYAELTDTENPQGIMAVLQTRTYTFNDIAKESSFFIILDTLQDPGNMGSIIRTADAANVDAIFISKGSVDLYNPKVLRSTMGSIFHQPIILYDTFETVQSFCVQNHIQLVSTDLSGSQSLYEINLKQKTAIVIGNESNGVASPIIHAADILIKIPMPGKAESLNAAAAAAIVIYECLRQREA